MDMVRLGSFEEFQNLPLNKWGIKEPLKNDTDIVAMASKETALDLIIMPGKPCVVWRMLNFRFVFRQGGVEIRAW